MRNLRAVLIFCIVALLWCPTLQEDMGDEFKNPQFVKVLNNYFGCKTWDNGVCSECSEHYYFNKNGVCCSVNPQCNVFNRQVGVCQKCYQGYSIVDGKCVQNDLTNSASAGCKTWLSGKCIQCSIRWYADSNGVCQKVDDLCRTWKNNGQCQSCYGGYAVVNGVCVADPNAFRPASDSLCAIWKDRVCIQCANRAYFDSNGVCKQVSDFCATYDALDGFCLTCYNGYDLIKGQCSFSASNNAQVADLGCKIWDWNNQKCFECSSNWVFNTKGICTPVSDLCRTHDASGACSSCYKGFELINGVCSQSAATKPVDSGCKTWDWDNQKCLQCSNNWAFNSKGVCSQVSTQCKSYDASGACTGCFKGYDLIKGQCVFSASNNAQPADLGCRTWDWDNQKCLECSNNWAFNSKGKCVPVADQCKSYDASGKCSACYKGYDLVDGNCVFSASNNAKPSDSGCRTWDWDNQKCLQCSTNWVFNANKVCVPVSDQCKTFDASGQCSTCFKGYDLIKGQCVFSASNNAQPADIGCRTWDWDNQKCLECSKNWVFNTKGVCVPVSDQCNKWNSAGQCTSCYKGYDLVDGNCVFSASNNAKPSDSGCRTWDWDNQKCLQCSTNWVFNANKVCVPVSDQCKTFDASGQCSTCFKGYDLIKGQCVFSASNNAQPADIGCRTWDWDNQKCLECSKNWVFNTKGVCVPVSDQCNKWNSAGQCTSCYKGYDLVDGNCVFSASNNAKPSDSGCRTWDWDNQKCLQCSTNWVFNANKVCVPVSDQCKTFDASGQCSTCFKGYDLIKGQCVFSASNNAQPADIGCRTWDWDNQKCLECSKNWVFNTKGVCVPVSDQCNKWNSAGQCTSCYKGYDLVDGNCVFSASNNAKPSDSGCRTWDWDNQKCLQCSTNWVFNANKVCVPVSDQCKTFDASGQCSTCFKGYDLIKGQCVFSASNNAQPADIGCKTWDWNNQVCLECSKRWEFNSKGICTPVSDYCSQWNAAGQCSACYKGYDLKNGVCQKSAFNNASPADLGCKTWDWDSQKCLECSTNWVFDAKGACFQVSTQCKSYDASGACTGCFKGYDLIKGQCVFSASNNAQPADLGCRTWDWDNQKCLECSNRWTFNSKGKCVPVADQCKSYDASGKCSACYKGYDLVDGNCVFSASNNAKPSDSGCRTWDWDNQKCLQCSTNWVFNANKVCVPVSDQCKTFDASGQCSTCFKGYDLIKGQCVFSASNNAQPADIGCRTWDWDNQKCLECSKNWVFNTKGVCVPVSDQCSQWNAAGQCTSCFNGYQLNNGACEVFNTLCKTSNNNGGCASCYTGFVLYKNNCTPLSKLADIVLYYTECCPQKLAQLKNEGRL